MTDPTDWMLNRCTCGHTHHQHRFIGRCEQFVPCIPKDRSPRFDWERCSCSAWTERPLEEIKPQDGVL